MVHPWHDIDPGRPELPTAFIEIPRGSRIKYELDKPTGLMRMDRLLYSPFVYPFNYGFIPKTFARDDDPLDCFVMGEPVLSATLIDIKPLGMLRMEDEGKTDDKILGLPTGDPRYAHVQKIDDLPPHHLRELEHFLARYKDLESKKTLVMHWEPVEDAITEIRSTMTAYETKFGHHPNTDIIA